MELVPESIQGDNTLALDHAFKLRLINTCPDQLKIDIENERDMVKLGLWMEQFGIPKELLPDDLSEFRFRELLQEVLKIYNLSGTTVSVQLIAKAIGAGEVGIEVSVFDLRYSGEASYDGVCCHRESDFRTFAIDIHLDLAEEKREGFEALFKKLFYTFEPVGIHLREINYNGIFDKAFSRVFN